MPCNNWLKTGSCPFEAACSFYHSEEERRNLIDPVPELPEGARLPPMPDKIKSYKQK